MATYEQTGGRGEDVTKISALSAFIPALARKSANKDYVNVDSSELAPGSIPARDAGQVRFQ